MMTASSRQTPDHRPRGGWIAVSTTLCVVVFAWIALSSSPFMPSGADPGNLLEHSLAFEDPSRQLSYAPLLPWLMGRARHFSASLESLAALINGIGVSLLLFQAAGLGALAFALGGGRAGTIAYIIALASPAAWTQFEWGGYAQFSGVGLGAFALAAVTRAFDTQAVSRRIGWLTVGGVAYGLIVPAHVYSVPFFGAACGVLLANRAPGRRQNMLVFGAAAALASVPGWTGLARLIGFLSSIQTAWGGPEDALIPLWEGIQNVEFHPAVAAITAAPLAFAILFAPARPWLAARVWLPWVTGAGVLACLTPPIMMDRVTLLLGHMVTLGTALALAALPKPRVVLGCLAAWALLSTTTALGERGSAAGQLALEEARLLQRAGQGGGLVIATDSPSVEGSWFRGLTGGRALIGDSYRWYASSREREESRLVQTFLLGDYALLGRPLSIVSPSPVASEAILVFDDGVEFCPLFLLKVMTGHATVIGSEDGVEIRAAEEVRLSLEPFRGSRLVAITHATGGSELAWEFRYAPYRPKGLVRHVLIKGADLTESSNGVTLRVGHRATLEGMSPLKQPTEAAWTIDALQREGVGRIVASPSFAPRFGDTTDFPQIDAAERLVVFALNPQHRGEPPASLELRPEPRQDW